MPEFHRFEITFEEIIYDPQYVSNKNDMVQTNIQYVFVSNNGDHLQFCLPKRIKSKLEF